MKRAGILLEETDQKVNHTNFMQLVSKKTTLMQYWEEESTIYKTKEHVLVIGAVV
ncbi:hypothetical protein PA25_35110 [Pseudoalteromonas sp. A25]|nr:hypothetical protein PA25_35110 [Pseudoalteromonas sp. A25]